MSPVADERQGQEVNHPATASGSARAVLAELVGPPAERALRVRYWDGSLEGPATDEGSQLPICLGRQGALRRMLLPPSELSLGEAYLRGETWPPSITIEKAAKMARFSGRGMIGTDETIDHDIVDRMGVGFVREVGIPAIDQARAKGKSCESICATLRKD